MNILMLFYAYKRLDTSLVLLINYLIRNISRSKVFFECDIIVIGPLPTKIEVKFSCILKKKNVANNVEQIQYQYIEFAPTAVKCLLMIKF